jgi:hypothetical protein
VLDARHAVAKRASAMHDMHNLHTHIASQIAISHYMETTYKEYSSPENFEFDAA